MRRGTEKQLYKRRFGRNNMTKEYIGTGRCQVGIK
jgi:hypothetical protein